jgi:hypothetical protein
MAHPRRRWVASSIAAPDGPPRDCLAAAPGNPPGIPTPASQPALARGNNGNTFRSLGFGSVRSLSPISAQRSRLSERSERLRLIAPRTSAFESA